MNSKTNRNNHDFQIAYFLAGSCHTPDGAYALLCDLRDDRDLALKSVQAAQLRNRAKFIRATQRMSSADEAERLEGEADLAEISAFSEIEQKNISAAIAELAFIDKCIEKVQPLRKFSHLPDPEAHEAAQRDEWKLEFIRRAENQMLLTGTISPDDFAHMRMHPDFAEVIAPAITIMGTLMKLEGGRERMLELCAQDKKEFDLPLLLTTEKAA